MCCVLREIADTKQLINFHFKPNPKSWNKKEKGEVGMSKLFNYQSWENIEETRQQFKTVPYRLEQHITWTGIDGSRFLYSIIKSHTRAHLVIITPENNYTQKQQHQFWLGSLFVLCLELALIDEANPVVRE